MKKQGREKIKIIFVVIPILFLAIISTKITYAQEDNDVEEQVVTKQEEIKKIDLEELEYTQDYKIWKSLPEEEREKYIEPSPFGTAYEPVEVNDSNKRSIFKIKASRTSSFDLRDYISIKVKDQKQTQSCWTFPIVSEVETNISLTRGYSSPIFSTRHMEYTTAKTFLDGTNVNGYNREVGSGGNSAVGLSYYTSGLGPVLEKDMPFQNSEAKINLSEINKPVGQKIEKYVDFPSIYKEIENGVTVYKDNQGNSLSDDAVNEIRQQIKDHIATYGAVSANTNSSAVQYFNNSSPILATSYYCNNNSVLQDHLVTIIGWDDNYAKEHFNSSCRPSKDGAWLALNSYGAGFNGGYYYISYEDVMIERQNTGIVSVKDRDYKNLYQYDILAGNINFSPEIGETGKHPTTMYAANIFTRKESQKENLKEIAITGKGGRHTIDVYVNTKGELNLTDATLVASGVTLEEGYQTIKLTTPIALTNNKFAVMVKYNHSEKVTVAVEASLTANGFGDVSTKWDTATANEGEGFISLNGKNENWQDIATMMPTASLCIKAFTTVDDTQGPTITFEPNGNGIWACEQKSKITVTDGSGVGVNESTLRYVWTQKATRPNEEEFENWFENQSTIKNSIESGNDWYIWAMAKDQQGNVTYARSNAFYLDNTPPTVPTIHTNVTNNEWSNNVASISIAGSTNLSGIAKYQYTLNNGQSWNDVHDDFEITESGIYLIKAKAIGNTGIESKVSEEFIVKIDKDAPVITGVEEGEKYKSVKPIITDISEINAVLTKDGVEKVYPINSQNEGEEITESGNYILTVTDEMGNKTILHFIIDADQTPPVITFTPNGSTLWKRGQSTQITVTHTSDLKPESLKYIWSQSETAPTEEQITNGFHSGETITKNTDSGIWYIWAIAKDTLGNTAINRSEGFYLDNNTPTAPTITANAENNQTIAENATVSLSGSQSPSGIRKYQYSINDKVTWRDVSESENFKFQKDGTYVIFARAVNNVGKTGEITGPYTIKIDTSAPKIKGVEDGGSYQEVTPIIEDDSEVEIKLIKDGEEVPYEKGDKITEDGNYTIKATDEMENETEITFVIDSTGPTITFEPNGNINWATSQSTKVTITDKNGIDESSIRYKWTQSVQVLTEETFMPDSLPFKNGEVLKKDSVSGDDWCLWVYAKDTKGNMALSKSSKFYIDNTVPTAPILTVQTKERATINDSMEFGISGSTCLSGIAKYQYSLDGGTTWRDIDVGKNLILNEIGDYQVEARAVSNVGIIGKQSQKEEVSIRTKIPTISFMPDGNKNYQKKQSTKIEVGSKFNLKEESLKYIWSNQAEGINQTDFTKDTLVGNYQNNETIAKETDSGIWYLWAIAENEVGDVKIQRSEAFYLDNDDPIIEGVEKGKVYQDEITPVIQDKTSKIKVEVMLDGKQYDYQLGEHLKENGVYQINVQDEAGNTADTTFVMQYKEKDVTGPMVSFSPNGNKEYKKEQGTKVEVVDPSGVKEESLKYIWTDSKEKPNEKDFKENFKNGDTIINKEDTGKVYLWIYAEDKEGNKSIIRSDEFYLDNTPPKTPVDTTNVENNSNMQEQGVIKMESGEGESKTDYDENRTGGGKTWNKQDKITYNAKSSTSSKDSNISPISLPRTGVTTVLLIGITVLVGLAIYSYVKLKKCKGDR